jgi:hypothetical protein
MVVINKSFEMEEIKTTTRKAIKEHKCCHCGFSIHKGVEYNHRVYKYEGYINTDKCHSDCQKAAEFDGEVRRVYWGKLFVFV